MTNFEIPDTTWYIPLIVLFSMQTFVYFIVQIFCKRDNSWMDAMWGLCFAVPNAVIWGIRASNGDTINPRMLLITIPVFIWSTRLAAYIAIRHRGEDYRYK